MQVVIKKIVSCYYSNNLRGIGAKFEVVAKEKFYGQLLAIVQQN